MKRGKSKARSLSVAAGSAMSVRRANRIVRGLGMVVTREYPGHYAGWTICLGKLRDGRHAPKWLASLNGCDTCEIARRALLFSSQNIAGQTPEGEARRLSVTAR